MAVNFRPDPSTPLEEQINNTLLSRSAIRSATLIRRFPTLRVWNIQQKAPEKRDNSWYVGLAHSEDCWLLNTKLTPSNVNVEFRYPQYLPFDVVQMLPWHNNSWQRAPLNTFGDSEVAKMIGQYIEAIEADWLAGKVKKGGQSVAEVLLFRLLQVLYPSVEIVRNRRPDDLRSAKNRPLELDIYIPELKLAIEVQGEQHFKDLYGSSADLKANDQRKKELCKERSIKLAWVNWLTLTNELFRQTEAVKIDHVRSVFGRFLESAHTFMWWQDMSNQSFE